MSDQVTTLTTYDSLTITNPDTVAGSYNDVTVMASTPTLADTGGTSGTYVMGDLQSHTDGWGITSAGGTVYSLSYSFNITPGVTSSFLDFSHPQLSVTDGPDGSGEIDGTSAANASAWTSQYAAWLASLGAGDWQLSGELDLKTGVNSQHSGAWDQNGVVATLGGGVTSNDAGSHDTILGFQVTTDSALPHDTVSLGANVTEALFDKYFSVTSTTHQEGPTDDVHTVNDTTIALGDSWSIDIYHLDTTAYTTDAAIHQYVWDYVLAH